MNQVRTITSKPKIRLRIGPNYSSVTNVVRENKLHTVCEEARCPNIYECWENGTATLMILGNVCTRACGFCSVKTGKPTWNDSMEPFRTALTVKKMRLRHVVITSVDRDDLKNDYGAEIWAETIYQIHFQRQNYYLSEENFLYQITIEICPYFLEPPSTFFLLQWALNF